MFYYLEEKTSWEPCIYNLEVMMKEGWKTNVMPYHGAVEGTEIPNMFYW